MFGYNSALSKRYTDVKYVINNLVRGNFNDTTGWIATYGTLATLDNVGVVTANGSSYSVKLQYTTNIKFVTEKRIYYKAQVRVNNNDATDIRTRMLGSTGGSSTTLAYKSLPDKDTWYDLEGVFTPTNQTGFVVCDIYCVYPDTATAIGKVMEVRNVIVIDLTSKYSDGNEPSLKEISDIVSLFPPGWEEIDSPLYTLEQLHLLDANKFRLDFSTVELPTSINVYGNNRLSLIATKKDNYYNAENPPIQFPQDIGYLYLDEVTEKLYYSAGKFDNPLYLCDWNPTIAGDYSACKDWIPSISKDGDIIFLQQGKTGRANPIVYPHGDYGNPVVVDFGVDQKPAGLTTDTGLTHSFYGDFFIYGEYRSNGFSEYNGEPMHIWKVSKPYINKVDWQIVDTWYYSNTGDPWGENPTREITHFHTIAYDFYTGNWYANTGDLDAHCRVLKSIDDGDTWSEIVSNGQKWRTLGYIFTEDACYWGTDSSSSAHVLYKATRDVNGDIDFATTQPLTTLSTSGQRVYNTCLIREPYGLLLLDRAEPRIDGLFDIEFWSFEDERLYNLGTYTKSEIETVERYGLGNMAVTYYQNNQEDGIICGSSTYERYISIDVLGNTPENRIGVLKLKVLRN